MPYTTVDRIQRRLPGRLNLTGSSTIFGQPGVEPAFVADMISQCEAMVDSHLRQRYQYPLKLGSPETVAVLGSIVEQLVAAEIVDAYYWTEEQSGEIASRYRERAMESLVAFASGDRTLTGEIIIPAGSSREPRFTHISNERPAAPFDSSFDFKTQRHRR